MNIVIKVIWNNFHFARTRFKNPFGDSGLLRAPGNGSVDFFPVPHSLFQKHKVDFNSK